MRLAINDGYTLTASTLPDYTDGNRTWSDLPTVEFIYRPALPEAIYEWQHDDLRAANGKAALDAAAKLIAAHVVKWDVVDGGGNVVYPNAANVKLLPMPILQQILRTVTTWAPKSEDA